MPDIDLPDEFPEDMDPEIQQLFNDMKRADLEERYGMHFFQGEAARVPPEIERAWLEYIENFQQRIEKAEMVPLRRFVGLGYVRPLADLPAMAVEAELKDLLNHLLRHGVTIDFPETMKAAEVYRLLAEGLLDELIPDFNIPGLKRHFSFRKPG